MRVYEARPRGGPHALSLLQERGHQGPRLPGRRLSGQAEFDANDVGLAILSPLRALDEVAYLRFASVYRAFESAEDFENEIAMLRLERETAQTG